MIETRTFENIISDYLDFATKQFEDVTPEKTTSALRAKIEAVMFEVKGYGSTEGLSEELADVIALSMLIAKKKGLSTRRILKALETAEYR